MIVLGIDPSLCNTGIAAVELLADSETIVSTEVIRTEPSPRKARVLAGDDNARRVSQIAGGLLEAIKRHLPVALVVEAPPGSAKGTRAVRALALAHGAIIAVAKVIELPLLQVQPLDVKRAVCGQKKATKDEIVLELERRYPDVRWPSPASVIEHAADAIGAVLAARDSDIIRMARTMGRRSA